MYAKRKLSTQKRLLDLLAVIFLVLIAIPLTILFQLNFLSATILFFGVPSIFLIGRKPSNLKKASLAGLLFGIVWGFSFDYIAELNHAWGWSTNTSLSIPIQFFGVVSFDIMIWYFLWVFFIVAFYEYFAEYDYSTKVSKNALRSGWVGLCVLFGLLLLSKTNPSLLVIPYAYFVLGMLALIPFVYILFKRPILKKVLEITPFFIMVYLSFELTALSGHLWSFPGHYVGTIHFFNESFPFEELFFWIIASSAVAASYYEYFVDDGK